MTAKRIIPLVAFIALAVYAGFLAWQNDKLRDKDIKARAAAQGKMLVDAGWLKGVEASQRELAEMVPALEAELAAAKKAKAPVVVASHWEGRGSEVEVPCTVVMGPPAGDMTPPPHSAAPGVSEAPPSVAVTPHVAIHDAMTFDATGRLYVARKVEARLSVGETWMSAWEPIEPDASSRTLVAPELERAWAAYQNPPPRVAILPRGIKQWRAGWTCGAGVGYGVARGGADVTAACIWGLQF
jgi:hypothetical protein